MPGLPLYQNTGGPAHLGGLTVQAPHATANPYAGGNNPAPPAPPPSNKVNIPATLPHLPIISMSNQNNSSGGGSTGPTAAQIAAAQQQAAGEKSFNDSLSTDRGIFSNTATTDAGDYGNMIDTAFNGTNGQDGFINTQANIDNEGVQNELSKLQGMQGVRNMVNNGIQGAGVVLDNDGAGTSSAADAVARAYGIQGRQSASQVGDQYVSGQNAVDTAQGALRRSEDTFINSTAPAKKQDFINNIMSSAQATLAQLNMQATYANIPDRVNIEQEIANVKADTTAKLAAYDAHLTALNNQAAPATADANSSKAAHLFAAGTAPAKEFNYTSQAPATLQNAPGPVGGTDFPIFISSQQNKNDNGIPT